MIQRRVSICQKRDKHPGHPSVPFSVCHGICREMKRLQERKVGEIGEYSKILWRSMVLLGIRSGMSGMSGGQGLCDSFCPIR